MTAPPLPEIFGNYALKAFAEVVPPDSVSWLPQTAGWLWLAVAALLFSLFHLGRAARRWYRNRYRREAIIRLRALVGAPASGEPIADINRVLKITALVAYSRERVAKLSGKNWADFLNQQCEQPPFNREQMELLASAAYQGAEQDPPLQLLQASVLWVEQHRIPSEQGQGHA